MKRKEIDTHIIKHTKKSFTNDFRVKVDGYQGQPVTLALRLYPNGVGRDAGNAMTLEVLVTVERRCLELKQMARLRMNIKILIGGELMSVNELNQQLENFTVHDFLLHERIRRMPPRNIVMEFEGYIHYDTTGNRSSSQNDSIEHPECEIAGEVQCGDNLYRYMFLVFQLQMIDGLQQCTYAFSVKEKSYDQKRQSLLVFPVSNASQLRLNCLAEDSQGILVLL